MCVKAWRPWALPPPLGAAPVEDTLAPLAAEEGELGAGVAAEAGALESGGWGRVYTKQVLIIIIRLYSVKTDIFKNAFFWYFFIRKDLSRVDLIIKMVLEFLSNL